MTRVDFYHLQKQNLEQVLPKLLEKAYSTGKNIKVKVGNEMRVEFLNSHLWTFDDTSLFRTAAKRTALPSSNQYGSVLMMITRTMPNCYFW